MRVLYRGIYKQGTILPDIIRMIHYSHPDVEFINYANRQSNENILIEMNNTDIDVKKGIRRLLFVGSIPSLIRKNNMKDFGKVDHVVYISEFCRNIIESSFKSRQSSSHLLFGPLPVDNDMEPVNEVRKIDGPIQFVSIAKWYKRPYKRLNQIIYLYNKYLKKEYPDSILNIVGVKNEYREGNIYYYRKTFHNSRLIDIVKKSHIQLIPTPFDTGPKTIAESLHYRIPFVCSNNCCGNEYIKVLGKCGIEIDTDPYISTYKKYKKYKPISVVAKNKFHKNKIPYQKYFEAVKEIVNNYEEYTSWKWNDKFNYKSQSDKLYKILKG